MVQEYGRYFDMPTVCFRGGCLTGPEPRGRAAARVPRLPDALHRDRRAVHGLRLRRQAGARQHPQRRPRRAPSPPSTRAARRPRSTTSAAAARATARCSRRSRSASRSPGASSTGSSSDQAADRRPPLVDQRPRRVRARLPGAGSSSYGVEEILREIHEPTSSAGPRRRLKLSVVIPAHDEEESIGDDPRGLVSALEREGIDYELLVVDDASTDGTAARGRAARRARTRASAACAPTYRAASASPCGPASSASRATRSRS